MRQLLIITIALCSLCICRHAAAQQTRVSTKPNGNTKVHIIDTVFTDNGPVYFDTVINLTLPPPPPANQNFLGKSLMTPTAWPAMQKGGALFGGIGGTFPQLYTSLNDLIGVAGLSAGNPDKFVGGTVMLNINDMSKLRNFSANIILNKNLPRGSALSVGGIHLLRSHRSDSGPSYYIVFSHAVQTWVSKKTGNAILSYSLGAGSGRFYSKSIADIRSGKSPNGSAVFANISLQVTEWLNTNVEWSGTNLHAGVAIRPLPFLPNINFGLADLTRLSGREIRFVAGLSFSVALWK